MTNELDVFEWPNDGGHSALDEGHGHRAVIPGIEGCRSIVSQEPSVALWDHNVSLADSIGRDSFAFKSTYSFQDEMTICWCGSNDNVVLSETCESRCQFVNNHNVAILTNQRRHGRAKCRLEIKNVLLHAIRDS